MDEDELTALEERIRALRPAARLASEQKAELELLRATVGCLQARVRELEDQVAKPEPQLTVAQTSTTSEVGSPRVSPRVSPRSPGGSSRRSRAGSPVARPRAASDDGTFFSSYSKLSRVCSFEGDMPLDDADEGKSKDPDMPKVPEEPETNSVSREKGDLVGDEADDSAQTVEEGIKSLESFDIGAQRAHTVRCGYRLLACNDQQCFVQRIPTGLIQIPHVTKMLVKCKWIHSPRTVLIVKKPHEANCARAMLSVASFMTSKGVTVVAEASVFSEDPGEDPALRECMEGLEQLEVTKAGREELQLLPIDFCICIGGDGTIIWTSSLFPKGCPPVVSVAMGSLGFLSTFSADASFQALTCILTQEMVLTLRSRLEAHIIRQNGDVEVETVLNEVVVDRGPNSSIVNLDLYIGGMPGPITHVQGDGIIVATPTGSTAYSLSAGGSIIHPSIPCVVVTPICPHSLSFRPIVVSDTSNVRLRVPETARSSAFVSFDGRHQLELHRGDQIAIRVSEFPVPCVCAHGESEDWFAAIKHSFNWNERTVQKAYSSDSNSSL